jgi:hypothetical protein
MVGSAQHRSVLPANAVDEPLETEGIGILEGVWQQSLGQILITDRADEPFESGATHARKPGVARCRPRATMLHRVADFNARWKAVHD